MAALWWTQRAVDLATAGDDPHLAAYGLVRRALVTLYREDAEQTIELARLAQNGGVPPRIRGLAAQLLDSVITVSSATIATDLRKLARTLGRHPKNTRAHRSRNTQPRPHRRTDRTRPIDRWLEPRLREAFTREVESSGLAVARPRR